VDITALLEEELRKNGFEVVNVWIGSWFMDGFIES